MGGEKCSGSRRLAANVIKLVVTKNGIKKDFLNLREVRGSSMSLSSAYINY
jgi:hypothetical protein